MITVERQYGISIQSVVPIVRTGKYIRDACRSCTQYVKAKTFVIQRKINTHRGSGETLSQIGYVIIINHIVTIQIGISDITGLIGTIALQRMPSQLHVFTKQSFCLQTKIVLVERPTLLR